MVERLKRSLLERMISDWNLTEELIVEGFYNCKPIFELFFSVLD